MIIDTFPEFEEYWNLAQVENLEEQIRLWKEDYMHKFPELLEKQLADYDEMGFDWKQIARERVFPHIPVRLLQMRMARGNLLESCEKIYGKMADILELDFDVNFIIYVGVGCGAGWATRYGGKPACLFGLENIAEEGWQERDSIEGLIAHEVGHLVHMTLRNEWDKFVKNEEDPFFLLYSEGFAQRLEHLTFGKDTWHMAASDKNWLSWCRENEGFLAREFLARVAEGRSLTDFFGSWFDISGHSQTGYYLGHELIRFLENDLPIKEAAVLPLEEIDFRARWFLEQLAV